MKTADLSRSKRLKELGWRIKSELYWSKTWVASTRSSLDWKLCPEGETFTEDTCYSAPTAGEMIEWLLGDGCALAVKSRVSVYKKLESAHFDIDDNLCNALADACAWVMERKE